MSFWTFQRFCFGFSVAWFKVVMLCNIAFFFGLTDLSNLIGEDGGVIIGILFNTLVFMMLHYGIWGEKNV